MACRPRDLPCLALSYAMMSPGALLEKGLAPLVPPPSGHLSEGQCKGGRQRYTQLVLPQAYWHKACLTCALRLPGTPDADQALFEEILVECTAFQLAGALTEDSVKEAVDEVAELVLSRAPGAAGGSAERAAGGAQDSESAASRAAQAAVSAAVSSTGCPPRSGWSLVDVC